MKIYPDKKPANINLFMRQLGYHPDRYQKPGSRSYSKRIGTSTYPKFHIYINEKNDNNFALNLHLDIKKPSYKGFHAHTGEYHSDIVKKEAQRIKSFSQRTDP